MNPEFVLILVTAADTAEAELISQTLVEKKLVACCSIVNPVSSIFHWKGNIDRETEVLMILKSVKSHFNKIVKEVQKLHSYETPEIIAIPIIAGSEDYLNWIKNETKLD
ncbi:divalent-cation tolerance protein CutA [candidate division KSB1 bacterium]|nr:divalent-cation tolerance protein CutA [candidate division KSB1 bacterium]MBL7094647.1 divalent-cation tolerance protein CutA [candidate division KSB1 bacterium]